MYVLYINGKKIKALPEGIRLKKYLKTAMPSIIIYTLNEGLRFGRGIDYNIYAKDFVYNTGNQYFENGDLGFRFRYAIPSICFAYEFYPDIISSDIYKKL